MSVRAFDLNIEEVLENWEVEHALREVIANALDEQVISRTADIQISRDSRGNCHIRDFGRGLQIEHFTLNENKEKLNSQAGVIGKFGVGLKDALATFHRRGIGVLIQSQHGTFRLRQAQKHGFSNITTLHVDFDDSHTSIKGTEFVLQGVSDSDIVKAKALFLKFNGEEVLETTAIGQILKRASNTARIYILGVFAAEEPNFLFSYNITSLTESMKKRLNRERLNVGRTTYADRVKTILKSARNEAIHKQLVEQVGRRAAGDQSDEMAWIEISQMALNLLNESSRVVYFTEQELQLRPEVLDNVRTDGIQVVVITDQQKGKLEAQALAGGPQVRTIDKYIEEYNTSFQYQFVDENRLTRAERQVFEQTTRLLALVGIVGRQVPDIKISETMRVTFDNTEGVWDPSIHAIVIRRSKLGSHIEFAATLLHEAAHATTGAVDATRSFESVLTDYLGRTATAALNR